jgi:3-deoxy-manno-octulosonate cytidylyltransferase (CMP-KDO synthetase)
VDLNDWLIVIPARLASARLHQKPLQDLGGKPLIVRVYENLQSLKSFGAEIIVGADHELTQKACLTHGVPCIMTKSSHLSGTDRCAEVAANHPSKRYILNVQGDEPFVDVNDLRDLMELMIKRNPKMATLGFSSSDWDAYHDPNVVKIALDRDNRAIYFSRSPIPFDRDAHQSSSRSVHFAQHVGVYAFSRDSLVEFCRLEPSSLELLEKLEQLRAISAGWNILVASARSKSRGIDTQEDLDHARKVFHG